MYSLKEHISTAVNVRVSDQYNFSFMLRHEHLSHFGQTKQNVLHNLVILKDVISYIYVMNDS